ncbi:AMP-binding protein [Streptomyces ovatisporus]|uniref:AMP-binding protein n=1 Tax=Streptomyces ovatisporus TaxID=1128682 RepID=A0ABV9A7H1_9ACTN
MHTLRSAPLSRIPDLAAESHGGLEFGCDARWRAGRSLVDSVAGFARAVARHAGSLRAAGVRPGSVVAVIKRNHADLQALLYAALRVGAVPALLSLQLGKDRLLDCLGTLERPHLLLDVAGVVRLDGAEEVVRRRCGRVFTLEAVDEATERWAPPLPPGGDEERQGAPSGPGEVLTYDPGSRGLRRLGASELRARADQLTMRRARQGRGTDAAHFDFAHAHACATVLGNLVHAVPFLALTRTELPALDALLRDRRPVSLEAPAEVLAAWSPLASAPTMPFSSVRRFVASHGKLDRQTVEALLAASSEPHPVFVERGARSASPLHEEGLVTASRRST